MFDTGFCLWCQLAFSKVLENATQPHLNNDLQQQLLSGEILGATGLSNPMKSFNDLEKLNLEHTYVDGQLVVSGRMPAVSNIQEDHYFGAISKHESSDEFVMFILRANQSNGITLVEKNNFLGVNGCYVSNYFESSRSATDNHKLSRMMRSSLRQLFAHNLLLIKFQ